MKDNNNLRMTLKTALDNLWSRISGIFGTVNSRIDDAEDRIDEIETDVSGVTSRVAGVETRMTTAEGQITGLDNRVDDIEDAMDDLEGDMIKSITFNGTAVPKDAQGNVALQETDPTVPAWAKQVKAKTSDLTNDGDGSDNNSPFATQAYVRVNGGKIDEVQVNGTALPIVNKAVNVPVPTSLDDLDDALYVEIIGTATNIHDQLSGVGNGGFTFFKAEHPEMDMLLGKAMPSKYAYATLVGTIVNCPLPDGTDQYYLNGYYNYYDGQGIEEETGVAVSHFDFTDETQGGYSLYVYDSATISNGGSGGGGGSGAVDTITFDGVTHQPDASGNVTLQESDPTVPAWAKAQTKPTYTAAEVGALPDTIPIPSRTSDLTNDSGFLTSSTGVTGVKGNAEANYRQGNVNLTPANIGAVAKTGNTVNDPIKDPTADTNTSLYIRGTKSSGGLDLRCDGEGGNIRIIGPNGGTNWFEFDVHNNTQLRCYTQQSGNYRGFSFNGITGVMSSDGGFAGTAKPPTLISSSVATAASIALDLSAYWRIELDFCAASQFGHLVMTEKDKWYILSFLTEGTATSNTLNMYSIRAKYTDDGITVNYCGFKNLSTGVWNDRIGNSGYTLRNIYGYV